MDGENEERREERHGFRIGERIAFVNDTTKGIVAGFRGDKILIQDQDGFDLAVDPGEIVSQETLTEGLSGYIRDRDLAFLSADKGAKPLGKKNSHRAKKAAPVVLEIDLHIQKLVNSTRGMSNFDMLDRQIRHARAALDNAIRNRQGRLVFIHGVGDGVLRDELHHMLAGYARVRFFDAPFYRYGEGATEVEILP